jgi:hypothetical protein
MHRYANLRRRPERPPGRRRAVAIYGPTSSGKTAVSLEVCEAAAGRGLRPVVLNADSRQVYAGLDIGTSKIKPAQMRGFEHRLLDVAEPASRLSLEAYAQMARDELASLAAAEDALPVLVGGTGVYLQCVLDGWDLAGTGTLRRSLERDFPPSDVTGAYHLLARLAPEAARRVHPSNYGSSSRLAGQAARATWRWTRTGTASSSAWPRRPGEQSRISTASALLPPELKRSATSGRTPDGNGPGSASSARHGSTTDQRRKP